VEEGRDFNKRFPEFGHIIRVLLWTNSVAKTLNTRTDNKVCELATMCLPWQHWVETSISFDDVGISFHSCVVDLWQSLSEWRLLLSECFSVCRRENVVNFLLNSAKVEAKSERC
jgi:hypothetical protein